MDTEYRNDRKETGRVFFGDGTSWDYRIVKSDRRTMALQVTKAGEVIARIPRRMACQAGHEMVQKNKEWVYVQVKKIRAALPGEGAVSLEGRSPDFSFWETASSLHRG